MRDLDKGADPTDIMRELVRETQLWDHIGDAVNDVNYAAEIMGVPTLSGEDGEVREEYRYPDDDEEDENDRDDDGAGNVDEW